MRIYRHWKGGLYFTLFNAKDANTGQDLVVYTSVEKDKDLGEVVWVRSEKDFNGYVENADGKIVKRFELIPNENQT